MRVFISSTPDELEMYQAAACDVADSLGMEPVVRDPAAGRGRGQVAACAEQVATADLLLAIVGWRRGRVPAPELGGDGLHPWTYWEIRSALEHRKPVRVMMAGDTWRPELREEDTRGWAVMQDLRAELERLAVMFDAELGAIDSPSGAEAFKERLRRQLTGARQGVPAPATSAPEVAPEASTTDGRSSTARSRASARRQRLRAWPPPTWPERPYPLLLPYSHPELLAGRDRELTELRQLLRRRVPILGLHATSGAGKSSLLSAGLVPALRAEGRPVAFDRTPHQPGVAQRLLGDLVAVDARSEDRPGTAGGSGPRRFIERLLNVIVLAGEVPILVLDHFEELFRGDKHFRGDALYRGDERFRGQDRRSARAELGTLLAASVQQQPGLQDLPCRWLLAYRREFHGQVFSWLGDVLREARHEDLSGTAHLPHDLSGLERFHDWPLPVFGGWHGRAQSEDAEGDGPAPRLQVAQWAFQAAIEKPLGLRGEDGGRRYRWRFSAGGAERLARAFAEARMVRSDAPLVPELQVVLGHLLEQARTSGEAGGHDADSVVEVPEDPGRLIDRALEQHLRRALDAACGTGGRAGSGTTERLGRTRALLALHELADAEGRRLAGRPAVELARAIGFGGHDVLERMATPDTRLVVLEKQDGGFCYSLSHDRMAEVIARAVGEEGRSFDLAVDRELLALRRFVALRSELFHSGEVDQATAVPRRHYRRIADHAEILLWGEDRRAWWAACERRRQRERRWALIRWSIAVAVVALVGLGAWSWGDRRERRRALFDQIATGDPEVAFAALDQVTAEAEPEDAELVAAWRRRERPFDVFERGMGGVDAPRRGEAVLRLAELAGPLLAESPEDPIRLASLIWALDFFAPPDGRVRRLRERALGPSRRRRPPPAPGVGDPETVAVPGGVLHLGAGVGMDSAAEESFPISGFRIMIHEVTNAQYRRLVPEHDPPRADDHPAVRVNWYEAYTYAAWLGGRLPTEIEWEYAARAGCAFAFCRRDGREAELSDVAWWLGTSVDPSTQEPATQPVMRLEANPWGLFDIYGNAWEWAADWSSYETGDERTEPPSSTRSELDVRARSGASAWEPMAEILSPGGGASEAVLRSSQIGLRVVFPAAHSEISEVQ